MLTLKVMFSRNPFLLFSLWVIVASTTALAQSPGTPYRIGWAESPSAFVPLGVELLVGSGDSSVGGNVYVASQGVDSMRLLRNFSSPVRIVGGASQAFILVHPGDDVGLWVTDGSVDGTIKILSKYVVDAAPLGNELVLTAIEGPNKIGLWVTDGTVVGTNRLADGAPFLWALPSKVLFFDETDRQSVKLWATDGTERGTTQMQEINEGGSPVRLLDQTVVGDQLFFFTKPEGREPVMRLWRSNGAEASVVADGIEGYLGDWSVAAVGGNTLIWSIGQQVWSVNSSSVSRVWEIPDWQHVQCLAGALTRSFIVIGDWSNDTPDELWMIPQAGAPGFVGFHEAHCGDRMYGAGLVTAGDNLFFWQPVGLWHSAPWLSDGTPAGTNALPGNLWLHNQLEGELLPIYYWREAEMAVVAHDVRFMLEQELWGVPLPVMFIRGDANADGGFDISDPVATLGNLFLGTEELPCLDAADSNDSGKVDLSDAVYSLQFLFMGGPSPSAPFGACGMDPTEDDLDCVTCPGCP